MIHSNLFRLFSRTEWNSKELKAKVKYTAIALRTWSHSMNWMADAEAWQKNAHQQTALQKIICSNWSVQWHWVSLLCSPSHLCINIKHKWWKGLVNSTQHLESVWTLQPSIGPLDIFFRQITMFIKVFVTFVFGAPDPLINRFY